MIIIQTDLCVQDHDLFIQAAKRTPVDLESWAVEMMQKANRKSHLQAPLSPATQALLRTEGPFSGGHSPGPSTNTKTPTSGEIPIAASAGTSAAAQYHDPPSVQRVLSADVNGHSNYTGESYSQRPPFPPRTSSTSGISTSGRREKDLDHDQTYIRPTVMPIRPAPPPGGPLPHPPGRDGAPRRPQYPYANEGQPI